MDACLRLAALACVMALVMTGAHAQQASQARRALVIGNAQYKVAPLVNAVNDARAIAGVLEGTGFQVTKLENASQRQMMEAVRAFGDDLRSGAVGLFYFAGHGVQVKGRNYLVPSDAHIEREEEVPYQAVDASLVLDRMETAKNPVNIMILDACRNNPFARGSRNTAGGLVSMDAPAGTLIAFATAPGATASDGTGAHGVYTENLLRYMREPGLKLEDVFKRVRVGVRSATKNQQIPWENTSLEGDFFFVPPAAGTAAASGSAAAADPRAIELAFWETIRNDRSESGFKAYLERYPQGEFASLARGRLQELQRQASNRGTDVQAASAAPPERRPGFSFSAVEEAERKAEAARAGGVRTAAAACTAARRTTPIRLEMQEEMNPRLRGSMARPEALAVEAIARRLREAGLVVDRPGGAAFVLRGSVTSQAATNRLVRVGEVSISAALDLIDAAGRPVTKVLNREESLAGNDLQFAYRELAERQADEVAARIVRDFCAGG